MDLHTMERINRQGMEYTQFDGNGYVDDAVVNFDMMMGDGIHESWAYDENGNIIFMKQWG